MTEINKIVSLVNETKASSRRGGFEGNYVASKVICFCAYVHHLCDRVCVVC